MLDIKIPDPYTSPSLKSLNGFCGRKAPCFHKADPTLSAGLLVRLFNQVWSKEKVPEAWKKEIIVKLPKKGDLRQCSNWRGIDLLSVRGKICRVLFQRIKQGIEKQLREVS